VTLSRVERCESSLRLYFSDGSCRDYPCIWLRDNSPDELHPHTRERTFDLTSVPVDIRPEQVVPSPRELTLRWPGKATPSTYPVDWLVDHAPGRSRDDPARVARQTWDAASLERLPVASATACRSDPAALLAALNSLKRFGLVLFTGLDDSDSAGEALGELIGFKRRTNFGVTFDVISKPSPNNLAYTALALPPHTDLPNQELVPGYQCLHCYRNGVEGGASLFIDGFAVCDELREDHPADFELLADLAVPWRFHDDSDDVRYRRPIIGLDRQGELESITLNAHIADIPDFEPSRLVDFYRAYRGLLLRTRDSRYQVSHWLRPGEMVMFDNRRLLHGRREFDPDTGERHLRGFYIEHNEVDNRIRVLARAGDTPL
jgi:gamma-butyrobetaine dioxygenase